MNPLKNPDIETIQRDECEKTLVKVENILDKLYWWYDCEPQPSVEFEEGACNALRTALIKIEELRGELK
jgi:hypothetical protein